MSNEKKQTSIDIAIEQINQCMIESRNPNCLTKRTGDYRIGLKKAINILQDLKAMHRQEIIDAVSKGWDYNEDGLVSWMGEHYYNETYGGNK
jgi:hypothetical protein